MYLIVGANGFLGKYLLHNLQSLTTEPIIATVRNSARNCDARNEQQIQWLNCDITKESDVVALRKYTDRFDDIKVIYTPTFFNVNDNSNSKVAWDVNIVSYARFLNVMDNITCFYSLSTDMLFSESRDKPYTEDDKVSPLNAYAVHKSIEEHMAISLGWNIIRLPVLVGPSLVNDKLHFYDEIINNFKNGIPMKFFIDSWRSMLDFNTASKLILKILRTSEARSFPIINVSSDNAVSKYDFALNLARAHKFPVDLVIPVSMDNDQTIWKKKRPKKVLLDNTLLKRILKLDSVVMSINPKGAEK